MSNMTGLGKYQKGLELEKEGLSALQIATKLGYKDAQAWHAAKNYYGKKMEAFNARAAETSAKTLPKPEVEPVIAKTPEPTPKLQQKQQFAPAAVEKPTEYVNDPVDEPATPKLKMEIQITAEGKALRYRLNNTHLIINKHNARHNNLVLSISEVLTMLEELRELLKA